MTILRSHRPRLALIVVGVAIGAAAVGTGELYALAAAGVKGVEPSGGGPFATLVATLKDNVVWVIVTVLGLLLTLCAGLLAFGSRQAPDWLFKAAGCVLLLIVGIPAILA